MYPLLSLPEFVAIQLLCELNSPLLLQISWQCSLSIIMIPIITAILVYSIRLSSKYHIQSRLEVSENGGTSKWKVCLYWKILLKWMIWGYPHFRKPPYHVKQALCDEKPLWRWPLMNLRSCRAVFPGESHQLTACSANSWRKKTKILTAGCQQWGTYV